VEDGPQDLHTLRSKSLSQQWEVRGICESHQVALFADKRSTDSEPILHWARPLHACSSRRPGTMAATRCHPACDLRDVPATAIPMPFRGIDRPDLAIIRISEKSFEITDFSTRGDRDSDHTASLSSRKRYHCKRWAISIVYCLKVTSMGRSC
jgi:hypothetical protein